MQTDITVLIHTYNEEKNIKACINSAQLLTNNIIVVDMQSTDNTSHLVKEAGITVNSFPHSYYVEPAREYAIHQAKTNWVFLLDADERITKELADEILKQIHRELFSHYKVPRKNLFGKGSWLKHGGWWPDYQIRLINKKYFKSWPKQIHSTPLIEGNLGFLSHSLLHYSHQNMQSMVQKTIVFEDMESQLLHKAGKQVSTLTFFRKFIAELYKRLIGRLGFLDGTIGIIESIYQAFSKTITYLYLYEKKISSSL